MTLRAAWVPIALIAIACHKKPSAPLAPPAHAFDERVAVRDDCLHHAGAAARVTGAWLVAGACGHPQDGGEEEVLTVRVDDQGVAAAGEPVHIVEQGWATNVLLAPVGNGALLAFTTARDKQARAEIMPIDAQGRPVSGTDSRPLGDGRALALVAGPAGAAALLWDEPDTLSDVGPSGAVVTAIVVDADGKPIARSELTRRADAAVPAVALAGAPDGYGAAWVEGGTLVGARVDGAARLVGRAPVIDDLATLHLPAESPIAWPALALGAGGAARVAVLITPPGAASAEIWMGQGTLGAGGWAWRRVVAAGAARRERLAMTAVGPSLVLAWTELPAGKEFPEARWIRLGADGAASGEPALAADGAVIFDAAVPLVSAGAAALLVVATPPAESARGATSSLRVVQRVD